MGLNLMPREHAGPAAHVHERESHALQVSIKEKKENNETQKLASNRVQSPIFKRLIPRASFN